MAESTLDPTKDIPYFYIAGTELSDESVLWAIRCNGKILIVDVNSAFLKGWSEKTQFDQLLQCALAEDVNTVATMFDLMSEHARSLLQDYTPKIKDADSFTLQRYYTAEVLAFMLAYDNEPGIRAIRSRGGRYHTISARMSPQIALSVLPDTSGLLQLDASTIRLFPRLAGDVITTDPPTIVAMDNTTARYYFKPADEHPSFLREVGILLQLKDDGLDKEYRLPTLHGLVHYRDQPGCIMGMLWERIDDGDTLFDWMHGRNNRDPDRSLREKWDKQLRELVRVLHSHGIVWGNANPDNVVVDREQNLWVVDFGGGYMPEYVDRELMETIEGDLQGLSRISNELLEENRPTPAGYLEPVSTSIRSSNL